MSWKLILQTHPSNHSLREQCHSLGSGNWGGTAATDTAIYFQGDLVARVYDTNISLNIDVEYQPYIAE
ncbi:hypothetical protein HRE53_32445 (plasmid) [Acaryochloris sp. 'Moss Beach']|uniref:hypothetical protein n=1 Tax=Acaryochloris sp. 'Moss Beach' TaxID=2740837 RepID=UPI001F3D03B3|nr:hypothetical protein [Acaryochloris sp. 'Moss Beach']UJB73287.1 hypothetical protein HRE53_32445 [Acaryochloris sp. 'Moss Beach']